MTDYMGKVSSSELFRTLLGGMLKMKKNEEKMEKDGKNVCSLQGLNPGLIA